MATDHVAVQVPHEHAHDDDCGHEKAEHGDHNDFKHDGHWHAKHLEHWDEHVRTADPAPTTIASWDWLLKNWPKVVAMVAAAAGAIALTWLLIELLVFPGMPALVAASTVEERSASVGAFLVLAGSVLTIVAFVPALVLTVLASFKLEDTGGVAVRTESGPAAVFQAIIGAIPDLLKAPAGFGVVLVLLGVFLLGATSLSGEAPSASPTPTVAPTAPQTGPTPAP